MAGAEVKFRAVMSYDGVSERSRDAKIIVEHRNVQAYVATKA
jgi:hypothetical protein